MDPRKELDLLCRVWRAEAPLREKILGKRKEPGIPSRAMQLEDSYAYRIGLLIVGAARSPREALVLPLRLARLAGAWLHGRFRARNDQRAQRRRASEAPGHREPDAARRGIGSATIPRTEDTPVRLANTRIAAICDRFTADNIALECEVLFLSPGTWHEEVVCFQPHILFVESAWQGLRGEWQGKVAAADGEVVQLVESCRLAGIPTIFWNKEDPLHFEAFISTARHFDHVCTTDLESVPLYKRELGHNRVHLLPFALQPRLHNPVGREGHARPASFFAGAWYGNLHERCEDFVALADALALAGDFDILDRNAALDDPARRYPDRYQALIRGGVPYKEMANVCRRYTAGLTINTIKQSSSMYARRALELMGCGTSVYSNHCHALRLAFGDLVLATDDGERMLKLAYHELSDPGAISHRWRRLCALRKVLTEHTWSVRLTELVGRALQVRLPSPDRRVVILTIARNGEDLRRISSMASRQSGVTCQVYAVLQTEMAAPANVEVLSPGACHQLVGNVFGSTLVAPWHPDDSYGPHYLLDMCLAEAFGFGQVVGKSGYRHNDEGGAIIESDGEYRLVSSLALRRSIFPGTACQLTVREILDNLDAGTIDGDRLLSIDALSYFEGGADSVLPETVGMAGDSGTSIEQLLSLAIRMPALDSLAGQEGGVEGSSMATWFMDAQIPARVSLSAKRARLELVSKLSPGEAVVVQSAPLAGAIASTAVIYLDAPPCDAVTVYLQHCAADGRVMDSVVLPPYTPVAIEVLDGERFRRLAFRFQGACVTHVDGLRTRQGPPQAPALIGTGRLLLVANGYPARGEQYRNAFLHRRVKAYRQRGQLVDVVWVKEGVPTTTYEFDGVEVTVCSAAALNAGLARTRYDAIAAHFVDRSIWSAIEDASRGTRVTIWLHGAEIQSWQRRACNYASDAEREAARAASALRRLFWKEVFSTAADGVSFVFVSSSFMHEVEEDTGLPLSHKRRVIHNPIDTTLFRFEEKAEDLRWNILSVRPHASRIYANDLVAAVIRRLSGEPEFDKMRFHLVGDGELFDVNFAELGRYGNVLIERRFLTQEEIASLHRRNGVFLVPTRGDTQGVSRDEAMASGLVPVTCAAGSVPEFVDDGCGILTAVDDVEALAEGLLRLVRDSSLFVRLSRAAASRVRRQSAADLVIAEELAALGLSEPDRTRGFPINHLNQYFGEENVDA